MGPRMGWGDQVLFGAQPRGPVCLWCLPPSRSQSGVSVDGLSACPGPWVPSALSCFVLKSAGPRPQAEPGQRRMWMMEGRLEDWGSLPCSQAPTCTQASSSCSTHPRISEAGTRWWFTQPTASGRAEAIVPWRHPAALPVPFSSPAAPHGAPAVRQDAPGLPEGLLSRQVYALPPSASTASEAARCHPVKDPTCSLAGPSEQIVLCVWLKSCISGPPSLLSVTSHMTFISDTHLM